MNNKIFVAICAIVVVLLAPQGVAAQYTDENIEARAFMGFSEGSQMLIGMVIDADSESMAMMMMQDGLIELLYTPMEEQGFLDDLQEETVTARQMRRDFPFADQVRMYSATTGAFGLPYDVTLYVIRESDYVWAFYSMNVDDDDLDDYMTNSITDRELEDAPQGLVEYDF